MTPENQREHRAVDPVTILYTNWRGETAVRRIKLSFIAYGNEALGFSWGSTEFHPEEQMLVTAFDVEKHVHRTFALSGIKAWGQEAVDAALRQQPAPSADPGTAGRDAGAAEMRERAAALIEEMCGPPWFGEANHLALSIRALPLRPEHQPETTEGGERA